MIHICKIFWTLRSLVLKPFFGKYGLMSYMGKPVFLMGMKNFYFGKRTRIYPGVRLESHEDGKLIIGDNVSIGQNFHCTTCDKDGLTIGANTVISGNVCCTNIDHEYREKDKFVLDQPLLFKKTQIGENCFIGYGAMIQAGTILGKQCVIGANSVVRGIFPDYSVIVGSPAKIVKKYNLESQKWERINDN